MAVVIIIIGMKGAHTDAGRPARPAERAATSAVRRFIPA
jgi:hypothetical protein